MRRIIHCRSTARVLVHDGVQTTDQETGRINRAPLLTIVNHLLNKFLQLPVRTKSLVLVLLPLLVQIGFIAAIVLLQIEHQSAQAKTIHSKDILATLESLSSAVFRMNAHARGYLITRSEELLTEVDATKRQLPLRVANLKSMVGDDEETKNLVGELERELLAVVAEIDEALDFARKGMYRDAILRVRKSIDEQHLLQLVQLFNRLMSRERERERQQTNVLFARSTGILRIIAACTIVAVFVVPFALGLFARGIVGRLSTLNENVRRLQDGEPLLPRLGGSDELAQLDWTFHAMARTIRDRTVENELFVYSVSHDLRSPLVNLRGFSEEIALSCKELDELAAKPSPARADIDRIRSIVREDLPASLKFIRSAVIRMASITDALLKLSRAGRVEYRWQQVQLGPVIENIVHALGNTISEKRCEVKAAELPMVYGDPTALDQLFGNLLANALQYLDPSRPGEITVGTAERRDDGFVTIFVRDNGLGLPAAAKEKLFLAFQRFHTDRGPGEGIGLALTKRIVDRHRGRITVDSSEGAGTTFYVTLPEHGPDRLQQEFESRATYRELRQPTDHQLLAPATAARRMTSNRTEATSNRSEAGGVRPGSIQSHV